MKVSLNWLKEYVALTLSPIDLAEKLTLAGLEVKGTEVIGGNWGNIFVGQIAGLNPHPNADRLTLATVNLGNEPITVVCGAPNLRLGDKIAFARVGAQLLDGHSGQVFRLKSAKIRGVVSSGMICSEKELGISDRHEGIMVLSSDAPVGLPLADYLGDVIWNLEVTPNRPDCLSAIGLAREVAALTGQSLRLPEFSYEEEVSFVEQQVTIEILAPDLCPRYCASLISGVKVAESPQWMQERLLAGGMRPINNIVDVTNYVMLEYGQPLHAFDYAQIRGRKIIVRRALSGENMVTLDGAERTLSSDMLVIADKERAVAVAGVMGGANSEVTQETTSILLESANFNPTNIYHTGRALGLSSEACMRFERGIRPEVTLPALRRATQLMTQLAGGKAAQGWVDVYPGKLAPKPIMLSTTQVKRCLGVDFSLEEVVKVLSSLGFDCQPAEATSIMVTAPYWRSDIRFAVDLIEEVARITGYEQIPTTMLSQSIPRQDPAPIIRLKRNIRHHLAAFGFQEVLTYSLTSLVMLERLLPEPRPLEPRLFRVANPMTAEQEYLRPNLRANLLATLVANRRYEEGSLRLFEVGRVYLRRAKDLPDEPEMLAGILSGPRVEKWWQSRDQSLDFFEAKGVVEGLFRQLGVEVNFEPSQDESLHPSKQIAIVIEGNRLGVVGEVHPKVLANFEVAEVTYLFEVDLAALLPFTLGHKVFQPIPRFPPTVRDIALVVDSSITYQKIQNVFRAFPLVAKVALFDVYRGEQITRGQKSLAYRLTFQSPTQTLTDDEVNKVQQQILDKLSQELGATLRG